MERSSLFDLLAGELYYLNRTGYTGKIAPLMRRLERLEPTLNGQVLLWTNLPELEAFRDAMAQNPASSPEVVKLEANDWRARAEFLEAVAAQGGLEIVFDLQHVHRTGEAMLEVEAQKTLTACL